MDKIGHKQVYGAGYHAGLKAGQDNNSVIRGRDRGYLNATNSILCWNPGTSKVKIIPWPDTEDRSRGYEMTALACYTDVRKMNFEQRKTVIFVEAMHLIIRDGCDPSSVHFALLNLEEYRDGCACDMPWLNDWIL